MGTFRVTVQATGNHGCMRDKGAGETVIGCERPGCVDCITREYVRRLKRSGANFDTGGEATLQHWPGTESEVIDDLLTGVRAGSF